MRDRSPDSNPNLPPAGSNPEQDPGTPENPTGLPVNPDSLSRRLIRNRYAISRGVAARL